MGHHGSKGYENEAGVYIKTTGYSDGSGAKIDFYDNDPSQDHKSIHLNVDCDKGTWSSASNVSGELEKSSGSCYLTSACMRHLQEKFDDDCHELTVLRWFRDNFVSEEDVKQYYKTAPMIVEAINKDPSCNHMYNHIYHNVIKLCVNAIENEDYENAYNRYKDNLFNLKSLLNI